VLRELMRETLAAQVAALVDACRPKQGLRWPREWIQRSNGRVLRSRWWRGLSPEQQDVEVQIAIVDVVGGDGKDPRGWAYYERKALPARWLFPKVVRKLAQRAKREDAWRWGLGHDADAGSLQDWRRRPADVIDESEDRRTQLAEADPELATTIKDGETQQAMAQLTGMPVSTLKKRIGRAKAHFAGPRSGRVRPTRQRASRRKRVSDSEAGLPLVSCFCGHGEGTPPFSCLRCRVVTVAS